jgi:hypothetical protein
MALIEGHTPEKKRRLAMEVPGVGEIFKSKLNGKEYELKRIADQMAVLHALDGSSQILTGEGNIHLFFETVFRDEASKIG